MPLTIRDEEYEKGKTTTLRTFASYYCVSITITFPEPNNRQMALLENGQSIAWSMIGSLHRVVVNPVYMTRYICKKISTPGQ